MEKFNEGKLQAEMSDFKWRIEDIFANVLIGIKIYSKNKALTMNSFLKIINLSTNLVFLLKIMLSRFDSFDCRVLFFVSWINEIIIRFNILNQEIKWNLRFEGYKTKLNYFDLICHLKFRGKAFLSLRFFIQIPFIFRSFDQFI